MATERGRQGIQVLTLRKLQEREPQRPNPNAPPIGVAQVGSDAEWDADAETEVADMDPLDMGLEEALAGLEDW